MSGHNTHLSHVKDLHAMALSLGANVDVSINDFHITPGDWGSLGRQTTLVFETTVLLDLDEGSPISLTDSAELTTVIRSPSCCELDIISRSGHWTGHTPDIISFPATAAHLLVAQKAVHIHIVAPVFACAAVAALVVFVVAVIFSRLEEALVSVFFALGQLQGHQTVHDSTVRSAGQASRCQ